MDVKPLANMSRRPAGRFLTIRLSCLELADAFKSILWLNTLWFVLVVVVVFFLFSIFGYKEGICALAFAYFFTFSKEPLEMYRSYHL